MGGGTRLPSQKSAEGLGKAAWTHKACDLLDSLKGCDYALDKMLSMSPSATM